MWDYYFEMPIIEFFNYYSFRLDKAAVENEKIKKQWQQSRKA
jgi:hypothetical protein